MAQSRDAKILSGSGVCYPKDVHGDGTSLRWKIEQAATATCPDQCGSFSYLDGYGRFKGITGTGTWVRTHLFSDGAMGTIASTYTNGHAAAPKKPAPSPTPPVTSP